MAGCWRCHLARTPLPTLSVTVLASPTSLRDPGERLRGKPDRLRPGPLLPDSPLLRGGACRCTGTREREPATQNSCCSVGAGPPTAGSAVTPAAPGRWVWTGSRGDGKGDGPGRHVRDADSHARCARWAGALVRSRGVTPRGSEHSGGV